MPYLLQSTSRVVVFKAFLSSDHISPATGKTIAMQISKDGGAFANPSGGATNATEIANGWYKLTLTTSDTNTLGDLIVRGTEGTIDPVERIFEVVASTNLGASFLDVASSTIPTNLLDQASGVEASWTLRESLRVMLGVLAGPASGMGTFNVLLRNPADTKSRVSATVDVSGNRSGITYDKT